MAKSMVMDIDVSIDVNVSMDVGMGVIHKTNVNVKLEI